MLNARLAWSGWLVAALLLMAGWATRPDTAPPDADDEAAIDAVYERFSQAYADLDPQMMLDLYTDDAYHMLSKAQRILQGKEELALAYEWLEHMKTKGGQVNIEFRIVERTIVGDLAYDVGYYKLSTLRPNGDWKDTAAKFVTVLKKQADGSWRFQVDSYSEAMVPAFERGKLY